MKIDKISFRTLRGTIPTDGPFWEERLLRPLDVYDEFRRQGPLWLGYQSPAEQVDERSLRLEATYLRIDTDQGVHGIAGPMSPAIAQIIATQLAPLLTGRDPRASEFLWDLMHRALVHGRQGEPMMAISAVDCALWDLKGKLARPAGLAPARRPDPDGGPGLCQHARLRRRRPGPRARARQGLPRSRATAPRNGSSGMGP